MLLHIASGKKHTYTAHSAENQVVAGPRGAVCCTCREPRPCTACRMVYSSDDDVYPPNPMSLCVRSFALPGLPCRKPKKRNKMNKKKGGESTTGLAKFQGLAIRAGMVAGVHNILRGLCAACIKPGHTVVSGGNSQWKRSPAMVAKMGLPRLIFRKYFFPVYRGHIM